MYRMASIVAVENYKSRMTNYKKQSGLDAFVIFNLHFLLTLVCPVSKTASISSTVRTISSYSGAVNCGTLDAARLLVLAPCFVAIIVACL